MAGNCRAIVMGASEDQLAHVGQCLSDWECVNGPLNDDESAVSSIPPAAKLIIVYARKSHKKTLAICEQLRNPPESTPLPMLLVISRYELPQGYAVERMGNATFIITPFDQNELREKTSELLKSCS